ncbi:MAG: hypothetical protein JSU96_07455 [Acidobacteriota bacterium]|nr:MAG: hypothetical protein JSU96_07455 [Acidobacteriota bacterium]
MANTTWLLLVSALMLGLIPFVPAMVELRITTLHWIGIHWLAKFHRSGFRRIVITVRIMLALFAATLLVRCLAG